MNTSEFGDQSGMIFEPDFQTNQCDTYWLSSFILNQLDHSETQRLNELQIENKKLKKELKDIQDQIALISNNNDNEIRVVEWLSNDVGLPQYITIFIENGFDSLDIVQDIKDEHLDEIGINLLKHREKIKNAIKILKTKTIPCIQYNVTLINVNIY